MFAAFVGAMLALAFLSRQQDWQIAHRARATQVSLNRLSDADQPGALNVTGPREGNAVRDLEE
jgi:hypothetical protein